MSAGTGEFRVAGDREPEDTLERLTAELERLEAELERLEAELERLIVRIGALRGKTVRR